MRHAAKASIGAFRAEGHAVDGWHARLEATPDSYDALLGFARDLANTPLRSDWEYVEPEGYSEILAECDPERPLGPMGAVDPVAMAARVKSAFLGSICGCMLGKPVEVNPTLEDLRTGLTAIHAWPLRDYFPEAIRLPGKSALHEDAWHTCAENIRYVAPDDDINYTLLGMLALEEHGIGFTREQLRDLWLRHVSISMTWGPERAIMARIGLHHWSLGNGGRPDPEEAWTWTHTFNPYGELCGAMIRADAYGYACPGDPALAAELAWRDAAMTHRKTGVYATMFAAAAIAAAFTAREPLTIFEIALKFVPRRSRFHRIVADSLNEVRNASDWQDGYRRIHGKYREFSHCLVYQECGTLINTLRFAENVGDGICKQVMQGNDTDSFGATAGSILGAFFGPGHLEDRWLTPFGDEIRTGLNFFYERSLSSLAERISRLPQIPR
jgi:ADP-ribosylglycohydrolase